MFKSGTAKKGRVKRELTPFSPFSPFEIHTPSIVFKAEVEDYAGNMAVEELEFAE